MPKNLTDVDTFTDPVVVPVGTDSRNDAAGDVELLSQALANRTRNLKNRLDANDLVRAETDQANTFTVGPQTVNDTSGNGILASDVYPDQIAAGNDYALVAEFNYDNTQYIRIYYGNNGGSENGFLLTLNAVWSVGAQQWSKDKVATSYACILGEQDLYVTRVASGTATWTSWPLIPAAIGNGRLVAYNVDVYDVSASGPVSAGTNVTATGNVSGTNVSATNNVTASNDVSATNDVNAGGDLAATGNAVVTGDFLYTSAKTRTTSIKLTSSVGDGASVTFVSNGEGGILLGTDTVVARLELPAGAVFDAVNVIVDPAGTNAMTVRAHRRTAGDFVTPTPGTGSTVDSDTSSGTAAQTLTVNFGGLTVDEAEEYWISIEGGQASDLVRGAQIFQWTDPGPVNI